MVARYIKLIATFIGFYGVTHLVAVAPAMEPDPALHAPLVSKSSLNTSTPLQRQENRIKDLTILYNWLMKIKGGRLDKDYQTGKMKSLIEGEGSHLNTILEKIYLLLSESPEILDPKSQKSVEDFLENYGFSHITLSSPSTSPLSGAEVIVVKGQESQAIAVLKLISSHNGIIEIVNSLSANKIFKESGISVPQTIAVGAYKNDVNQGGYYFLMTVAPGEPLVVLSGEKLERALKALAYTLAKLHKRYHKNFQQANDAQKKAAFSNLSYEITTTNKPIYYGDDNYQGINFKELDWLSHTHFAISIKVAKEKYMKVLATPGDANWNNIYTTLVYGDAHIGNFFFDDRSNKGNEITIIDPETTTWSIAQSSHAGDDVGKALASMWIHIYNSAGARSDKFKQASRLEKVFLEAYFKSLAIPEGAIEPFMVAVDYMKIRYFWMNALESRCLAKGKEYKDNLQSLIEDHYR